MHLQASHQNFTNEARNILRRALAGAASAKVSSVAIESVQRAKAGISVALTVATGADVLAAERLVRQLQVWHAAHALPLWSAVLNLLQDPTLRSTAISISVEWVLHHWWRASTCMTMHIAALTGKCS